MHASLHQEGLEAREGGGGVVADIPEIGIHPAATGSKQKKTGNKLLHQKPVRKEERRRGRLNERE